MPAAAATLTTSPGRNGATAIRHTNFSSSGYFSSRTSRISRTIASSGPNISRSWIPDATCPLSIRPSTASGTRAFTDIQADQPDARVAVIDGPDLETLVSGLNRLGVKPDGIIAILQGIKSAGALQAELVLQ